MIDGERVQFAGGEYSVSIPPRHAKTSTLGMQFTAVQLPEIDAPLWYTTNPNPSIFDGIERSFISPGYLEAVERTQRDIGDALHLGMSEIIHSHIADLVAYAAAVIAMNELDDIEPVPRQIEEQIDRELSRRR
jgi:hypothetical protein